MIASKIGDSHPASPSPQPKKKEGMKLWRRRCLTVSVSSDVESCNVVFLKLWNGKIQRKNIQKCV